MKKSGLIGASLLLARVTSWAATAPTVWFQWSSGSGGNDHWYGISGDYDSWEAMETMAVGFGYHLVSVNSAQEEAFLHTTFGPIIDGNQETESFPEQVWIGFNDLSVEGTFEWTDGSPSSYSNWAGGEPNDFGFDEDATVLNWSGQAWNDLPHYSNAGWDSLAIFESVENPSVPEASDAAAVGGAAVLALGLWRARRARA